MEVPITHGNSSGFPTNLKFLEYLNDYSLKILCVLGA